MRSEQLKLSSLYLYEQNISRDDIKSVMIQAYKNTDFSTFPYLLHSQESSLAAVRQYKSGNCIALQSYIREELKKNYNVDSFIIGSNVPMAFKVEHTPELCHCALFVPLSKTEFYIIDAAFYFTEPLYCSINSLGVSYQLRLSDIYTHQETTMNYRLALVDDIYVDKTNNQKLLHKTICVNCFFNEDPSQKWSYFLNQVENPDEAIGYHFLLNKKDPFILHTVYDDETDLVKLKYKLMMDNTDTIKLIKYSDPGDDGQEGVTKLQVFSGPISKASENTEFMDIVNKELNDKIQLF